MSDIIGTKIGFDNGVTGSIGIITPDKAFYFPTPTIKCRNYQKKKTYISRIDWNSLSDILFDYVPDFTKTEICLEIPMVNKTMFNSSLSAVRALEATLIILEQLGLPKPSFISSKSWQKPILGEDIKGRDNLKKASKSIGIKLYPELATKIRRQGDADGLLIAHWLTLNK